MKLLYISTFLFWKNGVDTYGLPSCSDSFFEKYLDVFDEIRVLGVPSKSFLEKKTFVKMKNPKINVEILPANTSPKDFINDFLLKKILFWEISKAEAVLIKPASRRGMMAIEIAKKLNKPYMIEMTGDIHNALKQHPNFLKRMYAPYLYYQIKKSIKDCPFGLYVSQQYLQKEFPIVGEMCGCSDVVLEKSDISVLENRFKKIEKFQNAEVINIALIGFYQGLMKGVDTAIRSLAHLPTKFHLSILGNGSQKNREKWYQYAQKKGVSENRIHFPETLPSAKHVLQWLDTMDFFVLPTRSEGFGRCIAEAMSRGCICFATDICTIPELLPKECLFPLGDDEKIAELLMQFSADLVKMKNIAKRNFAESKKYDFSLLKEKRNVFLNHFKAYCNSKKKEFMNV